MNYLLRDRIRPSLPRFVSRLRHYQWPQPATWMRNLHSHLSLPPRSFVTILRWIRLLHSGTIRQEAQSFDVRSTRVFPSLDLQYLKTPLWVPNRRVTNFSALFTTSTSKISNLSLTLFAYFNLFKTVQRSFLQCVYPFLGTLPRLFGVTSAVHESDHLRIMTVLYNERQVTSPQEDVGT